MTRLKKAPVSNLSPELLAELTEQALLKINVHLADLHIKKQSDALKPLLEELKAAFMRELKSPHTKIIRNLDTKRDTILRALVKSLEGSIANRMFDETRADQAQVILDHVEKMGVRVIHKGDLEESIILKSFLQTMESCAGAQEEAGVDHIIATLASTQRAFDAAFSEKMGSETEHTGIREIRAIRQDIVRRYKAIMTYLDDLAFDTPLPYETTIVALNDLIDTVSAKQKALETRKENQAETELELV